MCVAIFVSELNDTVFSEFLLLSSFIYCERAFKAACTSKRFNVYFKYKKTIGVHFDSSVIRRS